VYECRSVATLKSTRWRSQCSWRSTGEMWSERRVVLVRIASLKVPETCAVTTRMFHNRPARATRQPLPRHLRAVPACTAASCFDFFRLGPRAWFFVWCRQQERHIDTTRYDWQWAMCTLDKLSRLYTSGQISHNLLSSDTWATFGLLFTTVFATVWRHDFRKKWKIWQAWCQRPISIPKF